ncbi:hypothetical protein BsIDN1_18750 [Bacillus safensis]|uniref:Uncharacterized protein n=1 Tax=Bacillus safensis TaxID=561879 RepID=A0A5S9M3U3_BACIA|nr:hypothetical protein BsIDN1_18750 [Bacillus safensis]
MGKTKVFNDTFLKRRKGEKNRPCTSLVYMRQAGRSQPEYRALKKNTGYLKLRISQSYVLM